MAKAPKQEERTLTSCMSMIRPVTDALDALNGKWKLPIIISVSLGPKRFTQISHDIPGITDRMLSKELKELEMNQLITRTVYDAFPPVVEYSITSHGKSLEKVIGELVNWGQLHRKKILGTK
jgi:DNA-binding HxlR family transcriptional regulator